MTNVFFVIIICSVAVLFYSIGISYGRKQGKIIGKIIITQKLKLLINKVLELVPPEKYSDLNTQVEYLYSQINEDDK